MSWFKKLTRKIGKFAHKAGKYAVKIGKKVLPVARKIGKGAGLALDFVRKQANKIAKIPVIGSIAKKAVNIPIPLIGGLSAKTVFNTADQGVKGYNNIIQTDKSLKNRVNGLRQISNLIS